MENKKYALYTFLTLMIELSIASVMYLLVVKLQTSYLFISDALWHYGILKVICVTAALFLYFIIKCYYKGGEISEESGKQEKAEEIPSPPLQ